MPRKRAAEKAGFLNVQNSPQVRNKRERIAIFQDEDCEPVDTKDPDFTPSVDKRANKCDESNLSLFS